MTSCMRINFTIVSELLLIRFRLLGCLSRCKINPFRPFFSLDCYRPKVFKLLAGDVLKMSSQVIILSKFTIRLSKLKKEAKKSKLKSFHLLHFLVIDPNQFLGLSFLFRPQFLCSFIFQSLILLQFLISSCLQYEKFISLFRLKLIHHHFDIIFSHLLVLL